MSKRPYVPDRGDIVWLQCNPQAGHEQAGNRPALVLSPASYNPSEWVDAVLSHDQPQERLSLRSGERGGPRSRERGACGPSQESRLESQEGGEERDRIDRRDRGNVEQASDAPVTTDQRSPYLLISPHARRNSLEYGMTPILIDCIAPIATT